MNKNKIRILCYHGISIEDEHKFIPSNFITFNSMRTKLSLLQEKGYNFISLDKAIQAIKIGEKLEDAVVVTFDDGFQTILDEAFPWLIENKIPTTAYITTYYSIKKFPIFRIACQYLFWKTELPTVTVGDTKIYINEHHSKWDFIRDAERNLSAPEMQDLLKELQRNLHEFLSPELIRSFSIISEEQIKDLEEKGINIELHTHRHWFPLEKDLCEKEIIDNKAILEPLTGRKLKHFCYPSGIWDPLNFEALEEHGVESATTCEAGLVSGHEHLLALPRIIESEAMTPLQFEAEVVGIGDWLRKLKPEKGSASRL